MSRAFIALAAFLGVIPPTMAQSFKFVEDKDKHVDLLFGERKVLRYMNAPHDTTTKDAHELTFKPFHHVFDPVAGEVLLTNGAGLAADKANTYPHHRGLFYAFNKINTGDKAESDTWHGHKGEFTRHEKMLETEANDKLGRHKALLTWHAIDGRTFATEERELTVYNVRGGTLIDFASVLTTDRPKVKLDGDPQHAGFHFRAAMEVARNAKEFETQAKASKAPLTGETYYVRPDGKGPLAETRNWDPKTQKGPVDQPWDACSFIIKEKRYTVLRLVHPDDPKPSRGSERDYGRFGDYFAFDLTPATPLKVKYRIWVQAGEMTVKDCEAQYAEYLKSTR